MHYQHLVACKLPAIALSSNLRTRTLSLYYFYILKFAKSHHELDWVMFRNSIFFNLLSKHALPAFLVKWLHHFLQHWRKNHAVPCFSSNIIFPVVPIRYFVLQFSLSFVSLKNSPVTTTSIFSFRSWLRLFFPLNTRRASARFHRKRLNFISILLLLNCFVVYMWPINFNFISFYVYNCASQTLLHLNWVSTLVFFFSRFAQLIFSCSNNQSRTPMQFSNNHLR